MDWDDDGITGIIELALKEDHIDKDVTSICLVPESARSNASIIAKEELIFCGGPLVKRIITHAKHQVSVVSCLTEGEKVKAGTALVSLEGGTRSLLNLERTFLNFLQRLCGVATYTHKYVSDAKITVLDTRKTMPGFRLLDKYAVKTGGGKNHRMNLSDMVLVKNNHIDAQKGDLKKIGELLRGISSGIPIEVEVRTIAELQTLLSEMVPDYILLDNMNLEEIKNSIEIIRAKSSEPTIEVSGGVTIARCRELAGLDSKLCVSVGGLTTQARNVDISMRIS